MTPEQFKQAIVRDYAELEQQSKLLNIKIE